jgi:hypothetical protein
METAQIIAVELSLPLQSTLVRRQSLASDALDSGTTASHSETRARLDDVAGTGHQVGPVADQQMAPLMTGGFYRTRNCTNFTPLVECMASSAQRTRSQSRLDHHHCDATATDQPIPVRKMMGPGSSTGRIFTDQGPPTLHNSSSERPVFGGIDRR